MDRNILSWVFIADFAFNYDDLYLFVWKTMGLEPGDADDPNHDAQHDSAHAEQSKLRRGVAPSISQSIMMSSTIVDSGHAEQSILRRGVAPSINHSINQSWCPEK